MCEGVCSGGFGSYSVGLDAPLLCNKSTMLKQHIESM